ncbi:MAG: hypothetical protein IPK13_13430 [Deltaproteobacteria bacterium]|nr:hypothetical protein [Deltaproteobacteria bacterium]
MRASAPGKIMLMGEYAVLEGGPALIAAVNRRASGRWADDGASGRGTAEALGPVEFAIEPSPVVASVFARARLLGYPCGNDVVIDTARFRDGAGEKLGLGSSSAAAVVAAALIVGQVDHTAILDLALGGHRGAFRGQGSGVDVAASVYGGVFSTCSQPAPRTPLGAALPGLGLYVLFTGHSASTAEFVRASRACGRFARHAETMAALAEAGIAAYSAEKAEDFLEVARAYGAAMADLGADAGVPIVTEQIAAVMQAAAAGGGAAKPSGAGGGDIVVLWSRSPELAASVAAATDCTVLDVDIDLDGVTIDATVP